MLWNASCLQAVAEFLKERGAMNAFGLFSSIRQRVEAREDLKQPLLAVISCSADEKAARAAGRSSCSCWSPGLMGFYRVIAARC